jgi:hypothetical protein
MHTPNLNIALAKAKLEFPAILAAKKVNIPTKTGRKIEFAYAELEDIQDAVTPTLSKNGLVIISQMRLEAGVLLLATSLRHKSGEDIESIFVLPANSGDPKELGAAISYGRRYNTLCLLEITTVEPSDPEQRQQQIVKLSRDLKSEIKNVLDRNLLNAEIESLLKRKNISIESARSILSGKFNANSRSHLSDEQLHEFLVILRNSP